MLLRLVKPEIDILEKIRPQRQRGGSVYADDYAALQSLQRLSQDRNVAIIVVHHTNKAKYEDFRDSTSGSMGLTGVCDTLWGLARVVGHADAVLKMTGRDVDEQELAMHFAQGFWTVTGEAEDLRRSPETNAVLDALRQAGGPQTVKELCAVLHVAENVLRVRLCRMHHREEVQALGEGRYALPTWTPIPTPGGITYVVPSEDTPVIPVMPEEESPAPVEETPAPEEEVQDQEELAGEPAAGETGITPITDSAHDTVPATNGHSNGLTNGVHPHTDPGVNPLCPQCGADKCVSYGGGGRVCMGCAYCERPLRPAR
jgi:hypothetical protein